MKNLPGSARDLIKALDAEFPARCIRADESPEGAHRYAGKREVVDYLLTLLQRSENTDKILE